MAQFREFLVIGFAAGIFAADNRIEASESVMLVDMPDYTWYAGCFGTATGNLMGYWDRNGFPDFYTGPVNDGVAPLTSAGENLGIQQMWASTAHMNDYWTSVLNDSSYQSTASDPYLLASREEHEPDCIGDFIGLSQNKWTNLDNECSGNVDAYSFNFWDKTAAKRVNYTPIQDGAPIRDIQSGLRAWTQFKGHDADVFSQFVDFNSESPAGTGFTFEDYKAEIDSGYPVLFFLQTPGQYYRSLGGDGEPLMPQANPEMHGIVGYGYYITDAGQQFVRIKTSWGGSGDATLGFWDGSVYWFPGLDLKARGVIGYHPKPKITSITPENGQLRIRWDGAASTLMDFGSGANVPASWFVVEEASTVDGEYIEISEAVSEHEALVPDSGENTAFYRVKGGARRPVL